MLQICSVKDKTVVLLSTFACGNDLLTVHKDKVLIIWQSATSKHVAGLRANRCSSELKVILWCDNVPSSTLPATHLAFTEAAAQQINQSQLEHDSLGLETYMLNLVLYEAADIKPASGTNQLMS